MAGSGSLMLGPCKRILQTEFSAAHIYAAYLYIKLLRDNLFSSIIYETG